MSPITWLIRALPLLPLLSLLGLAACASPPPPADPNTLVAPALQPVLIRVLDSRDRPLPQVPIKITALAGLPQEEPPYLTDERGELHLTWRALVRDQAAHLQTKDQVFSYETRLNYEMDNPEFLPAVGQLSATAHSRSVGTPQLSNLDSEVRLGGLSETVVLRRPQDLLGQGLKQRPAGDPLVKACLAFHESNRGLPSRLGAQFAWPTFSLKGSTLTLAFDWKGITWGGLKDAPLTARVALSSGLPLALAVGQDLLPLPGVERVSIEFLNELPPEGDPRGMPRKAKVVLAAPAESLRQLAARQMSADEFLRRFPPTLVVAPQ